MIRRHLGETIDLHTGGIDLLFPRHENEIAQTEACNGVPLARHWKALATLRTYRTALPDSSGDPRIFASVLNALEDDLNLPAALGALFTVVHRGPDAAKRTAFGRAIFALGLKLDGPESTKARSSRRHYETGAGAVGCEAGERLQGRRRPAR